MGKCMKLAVMVWLVMVVVEGKDCVGTYTACSEKEQTLPTLDKALSNRKELGNWCRMHYNLVWECVQKEFLAEVPARTEEGRLLREDSVGEWCLHKSGHSATNEFRDVARAYAALCRYHLVSITEAGDDSCLQTKAEQCVRNPDESACLEACRPTHDAIIISAGDYDVPSASPSIHRQTPYVYSSSPARLRTFPKPNTLPIPSTLNPDNALSVSFPNLHLEAAQPPSTSTYLSIISLSSFLLPLFHSLIPIILILLYVLS